jgi:acetyl esterase/lipase
MSTEQRENLEAILRQSAFPVDIDVSEQRRLLRELTSAQPLPADVTVTAAALGGVPTAEITVDGIEPRHVVLYFHGGVYVLGDAFAAADLASQVGRRTRAKVISVDYRLAPEHPYPAAVDDALAAYEALLHNGTAPSDIAFAGESAGGGLAVATLVNARDHGLPLPAAAFIMSPYADLTLAGTTMETKRQVDPLLSRENLQSRVTDYTSGQDAALGLISPIFADLSGLPPLIIQAGTHEVLLDDALRLAQQAATADVEVTLDITPRVPLCPVQNASPHSERAERNGSRSAIKSARPSLGAGIGTSRSPASHAMMLAWARHRSPDRIALSTTRRTWRSPATFRCP